MLDFDQKIAMAKQSTQVADNRKYSTFKVYSEQFSLSIKFMKLEKKIKRQHCSKWLKTFMQNSCMQGTMSDLAAHTTKNIDWGLMVWSSYTVRTVKWIMQTVENVKPFYQIIYFTRLSNDSPNRN